MRLNHYGWDSTGDYAELEGTVRTVGPSADTHWCWADVETEHGTYRALARSDAPPLAGTEARVRVYRQGGGSYPDHLVVGWRCA